MIGVVLWSDLTDRKAVFWCEDQGDLAYYEASTDVESGFDFFDAGDMVQFDVRMDRKLRKAHNARLIQEKACRGLPESLKRKAGNPDDNEPLPTSARIIAFSPRQQPQDAQITARNA